MTQEPKPRTGETVIRSVGVYYAPQEMHWLVGRQGTFQRVHAGDEGLVSAAATIRVIPAVSLAVELRGA